MSGPPLRVLRRQGPSRVVQRVWQVGRGGVVVVVVVRSGQGLHQRRRVSCDLGVFYIADQREPSSWLLDCAAVAIHGGYISAGSRHNNSTVIH